MNGLKSSSDAVVPSYRRQASRFRKVLELTECSNFTNEENLFFKVIEGAVAECQRVSYRPQNDRITFR